MSMGKQVVFYADQTILETVNLFVEKTGLKLVETKTSPSHDDWTAQELVSMDIDHLLGEHTYAKYFLIPQQTPVPQGKTAIAKFKMDKANHIELTLFMKGIEGYDSRIWFQTPEHSLEKQANALLQKVRKVIKDQKAIASLSYPA